MTTKRTALSASIELLSRRAYSQRQLTLKLQQKGYQNDAIAQAIEHAQQQAWLDDRSYAIQLTQSRLAKGYGRNYLLQYLLSKGIDKAMASEVLALPDWDWYQALQHSFVRKFGQELPAERLTQQKCRAYLYRRGFDFELINILFSELHQQ